MQCKELFFFQPKDSLSCYDDTKAYLLKQLYSICPNILKTVLFQIFRYKLRKHLKYSPNSNYTLKNPFFGILSRVEKNRNNGHTKTFFKMKRFQTRSNEHRYRFSKYTIIK